MTKGGKITEGLFEGETINTPSMLCVEDYLDALHWAKAGGGLSGLVARADRNFAVLDAFVAATPWVDFLATVPETRSNTSVCLKIVDPEVTALDAKGQEAFAKALAAGSTRRASPTTSAPTATRPRACASGPARRSRPPTSRRWCRGSTGPLRWRRPH